jgi:hypothetical protein
VRFVILFIVIFALVPDVASATSNAETAKRCLRAAYMLYPYKRPGAVPMNGDRLFYFRQCVAKQDSPQPDPVK